MKVAEKRRCALAVLSYNNRHAPQLLAWPEAKQMLDDFARRRPELVASEFWRDASDHQVNLLRKEYIRSLRDFEPVV